MTFYYQGPLSDHFNGERFYNPGKPQNQRLFEFLKWRLHAKSKPWPASVRNSLEDKPPSEIKGAALRVSSVGHVTFLIQSQSINLLTDPVWSDRASPFQWIGPKRVHAPGIRFEDLPPIHIVLLSHNHYDHLDLSTLKKLWERDKPRIIAPLGNDTIIHAFDPRINVEVYDWGDTLNVSPYMNIHLEPMHHWSARGIFDRNKALWAAFVITMPDGNIYFVGDSGYGQGDYFRQALQKYHHFRLALLPIGAFKPEWFMGYSHMSPFEAIKAFRDLEQPYSIPMHYSIFPLADDGYDEALGVFKEEAQKQSIDLNVFKPLEVGGHWFVPEKKFEKNMALDMHA